MTSKATLTAQMKTRDPSNVSKERFGETFDDHDEEPNFFDGMLSNDADAFKYLDNNQALTLFGATSLSHICYRYVQYG